MSNSPLVVHTNISPNRTSPRNHAIDTITIHCVVGQCTAESLGRAFAPATRRASSNYGVDKDGRIGMYCEETDRSWCSSNGANDHRAITIEVASDTTPPYAVNDKAYAALIDLCVDICKRNNIQELKWRGDKALIGQPNKQNMTVHRWFAATSCPGDYLYERMGDIAAKVNVALNRIDSGAAAPGDNARYRVQVGAFNDRKNAEELLYKLKAEGFHGYIVDSAADAEPEDKKESVKAETPEAGIKVGSYVRVRSGAKSYTGLTIARFIYTGTYRVDSLSDNRAVLDKNGICTSFNTADLILVEPPAAVEEPTIKKGSKVRVRNGAKSYAGTRVASFIYSNTYTVDELSGNRAVLDKKGICTAFNTIDLILA